MAESTPPVRDRLLTTPDTAIITWPLTEDAYDTNGENLLIALNGNPISNGIGFIANGTNTRLSGDLPNWAISANAAISFHVVAKASGPVVDWREVAAGVETATAGSDTPKIELAFIKDPSNSSVGVFQLRAKSTSSSVVTKYLNRSNWRFEFRTPELIAQPLVQSLCWIDSTTLLFAVDTGSVNVLYRVDTTTGEYTGRASSTVYDHINSMHLAQDGTVWCQCVVGGFDQRKQLDLETSFSTGVITESASWNTGDVPTSSIAFATLEGIEYVLLSQFATSGTPRCYVFLKSQMAGIVNQADRVTRWRIGTAVQDLAFRPSDRKVYVSRSGGTAGGVIEAYDLATILNLTDDSTPTPLTVSHAPAVWSQGIDFHPTSHRAYVGSEGLYNVGDGISHSAIWSSNLTGPEDNSYLIDYLGSSMQVRLNGRLMHDFSHTAASTPNKISVGAHPSATSGQTGFLTSGTVRGVAIKSVPFTEAELLEIASG